jgi:site-specific DNA recombinase
MGELADRPAASEGIDRQQEAKGKPMIAAIYARKSTEQKGTDEEAKSVHRQIENARAFARGKGWTVPDAHVYADDAISGVETTKLRSRQRMIDLIASGRAPFGAVILRDASRFSRRDGDEVVAQLKQIAQRVEIWYYGDNQRFAFGDLGSNVTAFISSEMAAEYRRSIAKWTTEAMHRKAQQGHVTGGTVFGYTNVRVGGHVERRIDEAQAAIVRRIFNEAAAGSGYIRIAKQLNADGVPPPTAKARGVWGPTTIHRLLHQPLYAGTVVWNRTKKRGADGAPTARPKSEWLRVERPELRIVSDAVWRRIQSGITSRTVPAWRYRRDQDSAYLLVGFARCACGGNFHVRTRTLRRGGVARTYACTRHFNQGPTACPRSVQWSMAELDREVLAAIADALTPEEIVQRAHERFEAAVQPGHKDRLRRELTRVERALSRLTEAVANGAGSIPSVVEKLQKTEAERRALLAELASVRSAPAWRPIEQQLRKGLADLRARLTGCVAGTRAILRALPVEVHFEPYIDRGYHAVHFTGRVGLAGLFSGAMTGVNELHGLNGNVDSLPHRTFTGTWRSDRRAA